MALSPEDMARLANLAHIELTEEECLELAPQLGVIIDSVAVVSKVAKDDIVPTSHSLNLTNVFRQDVVTNAANLAQLDRQDNGGHNDFRQKVLDNAPAQEDLRFKVPHILAEEDQ